jgi:SAM-dependent methyltransferase
MIRLDRTASGAGSFCSWIGGPRCSRDCGPNAPGSTTGSSMTCRPAPCWMSVAATAILRRMQSRGWTVRGVDVDRHAASAARQNHGFHVDIGELKDLAYPDGTHDAVTARHVIEHVRHPGEFMRECWRILKPGGRLVFVTPNVLSLGHRIFRDHWRGLEPPRHLFIYGARSLRALANQCGIQPTSIFSTAQGASYIFRSSERARTGKYDVSGGQETAQRQCRVW